MIWFSFLSFLFVIAYVSLSGFLLWYLPRQEGAEDVNQPQSILPEHCSIVIAARNEEEQILNCLATLEEQSVTGFEVIVIDDHSEDGTMAVLEQANNKNLRIVHLGDGEEGGKKHALAKGIEAAGGELIIVTDADCIMASGWVEAILDRFQDRAAKMVIGPVYFQSDGSMIGDMQYYESLGVIALTKAGVTSGYFLTGNAANMAFRKSTFREVGGIETDQKIASGDDMFLIENINQQYPGSVRYADATAALVTTGAEQYWRDLVQQRLRWASKTHLLKSRSIHHLWVFVWLYNFLMLGAGIGAMFTGTGLMKLFLLMFGVKLTSDMLIVLLVSRAYPLPFSLIRFLRAFVVYQGYVLFIGLNNLLSSGFIWKSRQYRV